MTGKHLIIDLFECQELSDMDNLSLLLTELVKLVEMNMLTQPYLMNGAEHNPGITGFVVIEQSHISFHTFEVTKKVSFDLYSCSNFDEDKVITKLDEFFKPKDKRVQMVRRE